MCRYLEQTSGYARAQIARLIKPYRKAGWILRRQRTVNGLAAQYTREDIRLLAWLGELHGILCGPATNKLCERAWLVFKQVAYQRLGGINDQLTQPELSLPLHQLPPSLALFYC
jgi:hypothetical protein